MAISPVNSLWCEKSPLVTLLNGSNILRYSRPPVYLGMRGRQPYLFQKLHEIWSALRIHRVRPLISHLCPCHKMLQYSRNQTKLEYSRLIWLVLVVSACTAFVYILSEQIRKLEGHPIDVIMEVKQEVNLSFPAVTICNHIFVR